MVKGWSSLNIGNTDVGGCRVPVGGDAVLECRIRHGGDSILVWKNGTRVISVGDLQVGQWRLRSSRQGRHITVAQHLLYMATEQNRPWVGYKWYHDTHNFLAVLEDNKMMKRIRKWSPGRLITSLSISHPFVHCCQFAVRCCAGKQRIHYNKQCYSGIWIPPAWASWCCIAQWGNAFTKHVVIGKIFLSKNIW